MRVAVTGGSGVVGAALVRHLVAAGHQVRALARSEAASRRLAELGALPEPGDVLDASTLSSVVGGAEVVYHVAGVNQLCVRDPAEMWRVNVEGTRSVMTACRARGVRRLVHTSSAVTIGEPRGVIAAEHTPHRGFFLSGYERSKHEAERVLLSEADGLDVVAVNPSSVQGPGRATGTGRIFLAAARGRLRAAFHTPISVVDIDDCARGHLLAAEKGVSGERYLLSGTTLDIATAIRMVHAAVGRRQRVWYLRPAAVRALGAVIEPVRRLTGAPVLFCAEAARVMLHGQRYDGSKATRDLGLVYTPVTETIQRTVDWFADQGLLKR